MKRPVQRTSPLLIDDHALQLLPKLAVLIGLNEAIVLQQIHFLSKIPNSGREIKGHKWVWNTIDAWREQHFAFFTNSVLKRVIARLEKLKLLISCQPDGRMSRKKYYRVNYDVLNKVNREGIKLTQSKRSKWSNQEGVKLTRSKTETTAETSKAETSRNVGMCPKGSDRVNLVFHPSEAEVVAFMNEQRIPIHVVRAWWRSNSQAGWKISGKFRIHDWRKSLTAYAAGFKIKVHDPTPDKELSDFADETGVDQDVYKKWIEWGNRNKWMRLNPMTQQKEPIFDLRASLTAFVEHVDGCML